MYNGTMLKKIRNFFKQYSFFKLSLVLLLLFSVIAAVYFYWKYREVTSSPETPEKEIEEITQKIEKLMIVPVGEAVLATVTDKNALQEQNFFKNAENGDKVLIYPEAGRVILYRPSVNRIVDITSVQSQATPAAEEQLESSDESTTDVDQTAFLKIAIFNGTDTAGLTKEVQTTIEQTQENVSIIARENAKRQDYEQTIIVDVSGKPEVAQSIASALNGRVEQLPDGERQPDADIIIIVGKTYGTTTAGDNSIDDEPSDIEE